MTPNEIKHTRLTVGIEDGEMKGVNASDFTRVGEVPSTQIKAVDVVNGGDKVVIDITFKQPGSSEETSQP